MATYTATKQAAAVPASTPQVTLQLTAATKLNVTVSPVNIVIRR